MDIIDKLIHISTMEHKLQDTQGNEIDCWLRCPQRYIDQVLCGIKQSAYDDTNSTWELFKDNANLFYANAEAILADSRMMLAPVGKVGFLMKREAALGEFLNWWLCDSELSRDQAGNLIISAVGNPMTGTNSTNGIDDTGKMHKSRAKCGFIKLIKSFHAYNPEYGRAMRDYIAFNLRDVIDILKGRKSKDEVFNRALRLEYLKFEIIIGELLKTRTSSNESPNSNEE